MNDQQWPIVVRTRTMIPQTPGKEALSPPSYCYMLEPLTDQSINSMNKFNIFQEFTLCYGTSQVHLLIFIQVTFGKIYVYYECRGGHHNIYRHSDFPDDLFLPLPSRFCLLVFSSHGLRLFLRPAYRYCDSGHLMDNSDQLTSNPSDNTILRLLCFSKKRSLLAHEAQLACCRYMISSTKRTAYVSAYRSVFGAV